MDNKKFDYSKITREDLMGELSGIDMVNHLVYFKKMPPLYIDHYIHCLRKELINQENALKLMDNMITEIVTATLVLQNIKDDLQISNPDIVKYIEEVEKRWAGDDVRD